MASFNSKHRKKTKGAKDAYDSDESEEAATLMDTQLARMERQQLFERKAAYYIKQTRRTQAFVTKKADDGPGLNQLLQSYDLLDRDEPVKCTADSPVKNMSAYKHSTNNQDNVPVLVYAPSELKVETAGAPRKGSAQRRRTKHVEAYDDMDHNAEVLHDVHNANGWFSCFCSVCYT
jgi:hypothetical protein